MKHKFKTMEATVTKTLTIPVSQIPVLKKLISSDGWKEEVVNNAIKRILTSPRKSTDYNEEEIVQEVKQYRHGH